MAPKQLESILLTASGPKECATKLHVAFDGTARDEITFAKKKARAGGKHMSMAESDWRAEARMTLEAWKRDQEWPELTVGDKVRIWWHGLWRKEV